MLWGFQKIARLRWIRCTEGAAELTMAQQQLHREQPPGAVEGMEESPFPPTEGSLSESSSEEENATIGVQKRPPSLSESSSEAENTTVRGQKRPCPSPDASPNQFTTLTKNSKWSPPLKNASKESQEGAVSPHRKTNQPVLRMRVLWRPAEHERIPMRPPRDSRGPSLHPSQN